MSMLPGRYYDQWMFASRRGYQPAFAVEWKCDWKEDEIMTDPKDLEKFDPNDWVATSHITTEMAMREMLKGLPVALGCDVSWWATIDGELMTWNIHSRVWHPWPLPHPVRFRAAIHKPKPEPVKPSEPTADVILSALKCGKRVVDADGGTFTLCCKTTGGSWFPAVRLPVSPLTIKPEPKPRRRVTREEAIVAMVKDQEQMAWLQSGHEVRMLRGICLQVRYTGGWSFVQSLDTDFLYLDPPEVNT